MHSVCVQLAFSYGVDPGWPGPQGKTSEKYWSRFFMRMFQMCQSIKKEVE